MRGQGNHVVQVLRRRRVRIQNAGHTALARLPQRRSRALQPSHVHQHRARISHFVQRQPGRIRRDLGVKKRHQGALALQVHQNRREGRLHARQHTHAIGVDPLALHFLHEQPAGFVVPDARPHVNAHAQSGQGHGGIDSHAGRPLHRMQRQRLDTRSRNLLHLKNRVPAGSTYANNVFVVHGLGGRCSAFDEAHDHLDDVAAPQGAGGIGSRVVLEDQAEGVLVGDVEKRQR